MFICARLRSRPVLSRALRASLGVIAGLSLTALAVPAASAATHQYCWWDGGYCFNTAYQLYYSAGPYYLTDNYAYMPYSPSGILIYCGANLNGQQYASFTSGPYACDHPYGGGNPLVATEKVSSAAHTHGTIQW
jgi:hypothetical protein